MKARIGDNLFKIVVRDDLSWMKVCQCWQNQVSLPLHDYFLGAFFVERLAEVFDKLHDCEKDNYGEGKECVNAVTLFANLYNFKVSQYLWSTVNSPWLNLILEILGVLLKNYKSKFNFVY